MDKSSLTPLFLQYFGLKDKHPGCLLLMRVGDFFESYGEDAVVLARDADIALTSKEAGGGQRLEMAGVPYFALDQYLRPLLEKGHRIAIAEQMEDARQAKGLVRREVVRILTAGTIMDPQMLDERNHNFLVALVELSGRVGIAAADVSTGEFLCTEQDFNHETLVEEVARFRPAEVVVVGRAQKKLLEVLGSLEVELVEFNECISVNSGIDLLCNKFELVNLKGCDLADRPSAIVACAGLLSYLVSTQHADHLILSSPRFFASEDYLILDNTCRRNLELTETLLGRERKGSLLWAMDYTSTAMGARRLKQWMLRPLLNIDAINTRLDAVEKLVDSHAVRSGLCQILAKIVDIERLLARVVYGNANARELKALGESLKLFPEIAEQVKILGEPLDKLGPVLLSLQDLSLTLDSALAEDPPVSVREGGMIRDGYDEVLDSFRRDRIEAKEWIASLQEREREATGIKSLKVGFNQVFGYYLEVTKANLKSVPSHYVRKQTLANAERYFTPELKEYEAKVLGAEERIRQLEYDIFMHLRQQVFQRASDLREASRMLSELDVLVGMAEAAVRHRWCRPSLVEENCLYVEDGRHPVVERCIETGFVPNSCRLDEEQRLIILTGPNMSGKSTYLRQNALIVIMAHMGSFVPAKRAVVGLTDRVFTRVGASDDLHRGESTFMVEMSEAANILRSATPRSLVILDEIGRGTSTYDGLALARAIAEYLYHHVKAKALFATHFHELTRLARTLKGCRNFRVAVKETLNEVVFLHKIVPGGADRSYGIYVARLAGVPEWVLDRAQVLLKRLENASKRSGRVGSRAEQLELFAGGVEDLVPPSLQRG